MVAELVSGLPGRLLLEVTAEVVVLAIHAAVMVAILRSERRQPSATLAWLLAVALLPFVGVGLYLLIGQTRSRRIRKRSRRLVRRLSAVLASCPVRGHPPGEGDPEPRTEAALRLGERLTHQPATQGNAVEILAGAAATYRSMLAAIAAARKQIHVEFYIIQPDATGAALRDRLATRAREGIEVRVVYDAIGSSRLDDAFWAPLTAAGGKHAVFHPVMPWTRVLRRRDRVDFRNHRKLVVVDGAVGFAGGINIGREYLGLDPTFGDWRDTHLRIEGPAVLELQQVFSMDWMSAAGEDPLPSWFPEPLSAADPGALVQVVDSGPDTPLSPVEQITLHAVGSAQRRAWLTTPYFVPSPAISAALVNASLRGVDVRLLVPAHPDHLVVSLASRSYFRELLEAGARVYLYSRGFLHAKTMVVDSWMGTIGSTNMDMRSFRLNFELNAFVYDRSFTDELAGQFLLDLEHAREYTMDDHRERPQALRFAHQVARLLSPLL